MHISYVVIGKALGRVKSRYRRESAVRRRRRKVAARSRQCIIPCISRRCIRPVKGYRPAVEFGSLFRYRFGRVVVGRDFRRSNYRINFKFRRARITLTVDRHDSDWRINLRVEVDNQIILICKDDGLNIGRRAAFARQSLLPFAHGESGKVLSRCRAVIINHSRIAERGYIKHTVNRRKEIIPRRSVQISKRDCRVRSYVGADFYLGGNNQAERALRVSLAAVCETFRVG